MIKVWILFALVFTGILGAIGMQESFVEDFSYDWGKAFFQSTNDFDMPKNN